MSYIDNSAAASDPVGIVTIWLTSTPPTNWLILDGSSFSGTDYPELEALLGGTTLPDFRNIFPLGAGTKTLGSTGGTLDHIHTVDPPNTTSSEHSGSAVIGITLLGLGSAAPTPHTHDVNIAQFNSGSNNPPYRAVNFIVKAL